ncbi:MAG: IS200/IS605 family transposase [Anaerolineales bacterium]
MPFAKLFYHFVWGTKNRLPLIEAAFEPNLYRVIAEKTQKLEGIVHAIGGTQDHIHMAVSLPPKLAPAIFIGEVKGNASHFINHVIKPDFAFYWQDEYGVLSFGEKNLPSIVRYIRNQKKHHAHGTIVPAMENDSPL